MASPRMSSGWMDKSLNYGNKQQLQHSVNDGGENRVREVVRVILNLTEISSDLGGGGWAGPAAFRSLVYAALVAYGPVPVDVDRLAVLIFGEMGGCGEIRTLEAVRRHGVQTMFAAVLARALKEMRRDGTVVGKWKWDYRSKAVYTVALSLRTRLELEEEKRVEESWRRVDGNET